MTDRYARQMILPELGSEGQEKLRNATVTVIGAGGLGCPVLSYLAGAGVGSISIIDDDVVAVSNLHRQPLYGMSHVGQSKALAAKQVLESLNPEVSITAHTRKLDAGNIGELCREADIVLDCADSFAATYTASDYCHEHAVPFISASALGVDGYVGGFCGGAPSIRAVFPDLPSNLATCATAGVMGPVVGMFGALQAQMALQVILGSKPSPLGQLVSFKGSGMSFNSFRFDGAPEPKAGAFRFIAPSQIEEHDLVVELRGLGEVSDPITPNAIRKTADDFRSSVTLTPPENSRTVFVCRSGIRAWQAANHMKKWWDGPIALVAAGSQTGETQ